MKKLLIFFSIVLLLFTSCELFLVEIGDYFLISDEEKNLPPPTGGNYAIGDTGPGGGTIFYADSTGAYKEVIIGSSSDVSIIDADSNAEAHEGGGMTDWFLPNKQELNEIYKARQNNATLKDKITNATYWSTTSAGDTHITGLEDAFPVRTSNFSSTGVSDVWIQNFTDGTKTIVTYSGTRLAALYIRCVNTKPYTVGQTGPGGGIIFWVGANGAYREVSSALSDADWGWAITYAEAHTQGEKSDWYLPDIYELMTVCNALYIDKDPPLIDETRILWSTSESYNGVSAWYNGYNHSLSLGTVLKTNPNGVRAIRAFNTSSL